jgi:chaperonin GroEL
VNTIQLKKEIDLACTAIVEALKAKARPIKEEDIRDVAIVSGEYDWIADMVTEVYKIVGTNGYVTIEEGAKTSFETFKGIEVGAGYPNEYYITNGDTNECVLERPYVLVTNQPFEVTAIVPIIEEMIKQEKANIVLIAPDFSKDLLQRLTTTKLKAGLNAVAIKLPQTKDDIYLDIAALTKATFLDKNVYTKYEDYAKAFTIEALGVVDKAVIGPSYTRLIGGEGDTTERVKKLRTAHDESQSVFDKDKLEKRIAYLSGGIAVIRIGGDSDTERTYFKLKMEDAVNAVHLALKEGVVKGGGLALKELSEELPESVLTKALRAPYDQIQENSGGIEIGEKVIDPVGTTISALKSACSLAGMVITTEVLSVHKIENKTRNFDGPQD